MSTPEEVLQECVALLEKKGKDYNNGINRDDYYIYGRLSLMTMVHHKYLRIKSIIDKNDTNFESLNDSLIDLINYSAIWVDWERRHGNDKKNV